MDYLHLHPTTVAEATSPNPKSPNITTTQINKKSLGLLAEVAITRLIEEQKNEAMTSEVETKNKNYSLKQIRNLSQKKLLMTFAEKLKRVVDKNQKLFSYKCQILPHECQLKLECYARDENEIKTRMIEHLLGHLGNLEKSVPNIKISSCRKVKQRKQRAASTGTIGGTTPANIATNTPTNITTARKSLAMTAKKSAKLPEEAIPFSIQQSVITTATAPLDMTTHNSGIVGAVRSAIDVDKSKLLVLKIEEDHSYTMPTTMTTSVISLPANTISESQPATAVRLISTNEAINADHSQSRIGTIPEAIVENRHQSVIATAASAPTIAQTIEIRTSQNQPPEAMITNQPNDLVPPPSLQQQTIRAMALDYIDDIRKKSSSAAKSVIVNGDKSLIYQCKICPDKQFTSTNGLIFHYKKHAGLKPYVCELCSATFTRQHSLNYHMLIHLNKSRFICPECGRHFRHPSHFKEHMRRHTGETPFQCSDCLIRFKTRNTYKRHLQTKHAKILTSKGIIELSITQGQALNATPHQSLPNKVVATAGQVVSGGPTTVSIADATAATATGVLTSAGAAVIKPRRKYGIRYLHKNIETINKYEQQHQQMPLALTTAQLPLDYSQHAAQNLTIQSGGGGGSGGALSTGMGTTTGNITIVSIPQLAGMNTVHILDNAARIAKPLVEMTDNVNYQQSSSGNQAITLVSYQQQQQQQQQQPASHQVTPLEPIQPTSVMTTAVPISSGHLTELTSSPAIIAAASAAAGSAAHHHDTGNEATLLLQQQHHQQQTQQQQQQQQPVANSSSSSGNNDNFMRLLEAIALTEDS